MIGRRQRDQAARPQLKSVCLPPRAETHLIHRIDINHSRLLKHFGIFEWVFLSSNDLISLTHYFLEKQRKTKQGVVE